MRGGLAEACPVGAATEGLLQALERLVIESDTLEPQSGTSLPQPGSLELELVMLPRDAFFGRVEQVPVDQAEGRIVAELVSPYPPGVPVLAPGERINRDVLEYLSTGVAAGMLIPDAADPSMKTVRVVAE